MELLPSGGSIAVNMWYERDIDPLMERTENRPIQSGFISPNHALLFGICISLLGIILVSTLTNINAGIITALSALFTLLCTQCYSKEERLRTL